MLAYDFEFDDIRNQAICTCAAWITMCANHNLVSNCSDLIESIYDAMDRSENLYLCGVNCLISLFDSDNSFW